MPLRPSILGLIAAALLTPALAQAADLDENYGYADAPQEVPEAKVEFGTGWYVRGDIAATRLPDLALTNSMYAAPSVVTNSGSRYGYDASLGAGYEFSHSFRGDVNFDFHKPIGIRQAGQNFSAAAGTSPCIVGYVAVAQEVGGTSYEQPYNLDCHSQYQASLQSFDVLVNAYYDIAHWGFAVPYVGAGTGLSFGHFSSAVAYYFNDGSHYDTTFALPGSGVMIHGFADKRASGNYYNFAFALMAGVAFDIYNHTKLDIGYRYLNLGQILGTTLQYHEVRAGLRYMIDN